MPDDNQHPNVPPTLQERRIRCYAERSEASLDVPESRRSGTWFAGDLHCHSHHSDARGSVADIAAEARALGLDFVAIADHNTISQQAHLAAHSAPDFLLLPAQEVTTNHGHLNAWGAAGWLDFRVRTDADMVRVIEEGHRRRLFVSANHPRAGDCPWMYSLELPFDCFEVWNGAWPAETVGCVALWDEMLRAGRCVVAVGGSDYHMPDPTSAIQDAAEGLGRPTTWIYADYLTPEAILAGLRAGHASLSASPAGPRLWLMAETADGVAMQGDSVAGEAEVTCHVSSDAPAVLLFITTQGIIERQLAPAGETSVRMRLDMVAHRYLRAELREAGATNPAEAPLLALTNPLYGRTADL